MNSYSLDRLLFLYSQEYPDVDSKIITNCVQKVQKKYPKIHVSQIILSQYELSVGTKNIYSGTSGYMFDWWFSKPTYNNFYPPTIKKDSLLQYYAKNFKSVEINSTFYKLPSPKNVQAWYNNTPPNFSFIVKMSKFSTHNKKFIDFVGNFKEFYVGRLNLLKEKCVGILVQLPSLFKNTNTKSKIDGLTPLERIKKVGLELLTFDKPQIFIEFRDLSWFNDKVVEVLKEIGWSLVFVVTNAQDIMKVETPNQNNMYPMLDTENITVNNTVYIRFHGTSYLPYQGLYDIKFLKNIKQQVNNIGIMNQYYMFNNTDSLTSGSNVTTVDRYKNDYYPDAILNAKMMDV